MTNDIGTVIKVDGAKVVLRCKRDECESCGGHCELKDSFIHAMAPKQMPLTVGDTVQFSYSSTQALGGIARIFLVPILVMFGGYLGADALGAQEIPAVLIGLLLSGLWIGYLWIRAGREKAQRESGKGAKELAQVVKKLS